MELGYVILGLVLFIAFVVFSGYNKLVGFKEAVFTDEKNITVQLDERNKLFDSLINTVKKYMDHESGTFAEIVKLREQSKAGNVNAEGASHEAQEQLSEIIASGKLSGGISMTMEAYPELKSSNNMLQLQESIENIERKLANSKKAFNMSIEDYNTYAEGLPGLWIVGFFPNLKHSFTRWSLSEEKVKASEEKIVSFD